MIHIFDMDIDLIITVLEQGRPVFHAESVLYLFSHQAQVDVLRGSV